MTSIPEIFSPAASARISAFAFASSTAAFIASTKLEAPIYSDSYLVTYAAQRASLGDYAQIGEAYFRRFPFQLLPAVNQVHHARKPDRGHIPSQDLHVTEG